MSIEIFKERAGIAPLLAGTGGQDCWETPSTSTILYL